MRTPGWALRSFWHRLEDIRLGPQQKITIGDDVSYVTLDIDGITLTGTSTVWEDVRVAANNAIRGASRQPSFTKILDDGSSSVGVYTWTFDASSVDELYFSVQLAHNWKAGTDLLFHVHWMPTTTDTGSVVWILEYTWANIDGTFGNTTITALTADAGSGTADKHQMTETITIDGTGYTASSMIMCRLHRDGGTGNDDYADAAAFLECDFHYEVGSLGEATL